MLSGSIGGGLVAALLLTSALYGQENARPANDGPDLERVAQLIARATNQFRQENGRPPLKANKKLMRSAQEFADFMARTDKYGHTADGKQPWQRMAEHHYDYCLAAENIAWESSTAPYTSDKLARTLIEAWEHSPEHRKNLLDPDLDDLGAGVAGSSSSGKYYAVQDFGRPKSKAIQFKITNLTEATVKYPVDGKEFTLKPRYILTHQRCRPPKLTFENLNTKEGRAAGQNVVFHPRNGANYAVRADESGTLKVERQ
jgi:uncharacterized protein YkwD